MKNIEIKILQFLEGIVGFITLSLLLLVTNLLSELIKEINSFDAYNYDTRPVADEDQEGLQNNNDIAANSFGIHKQMIPGRINSLKLNFFGKRYCVIKVKNIFLLKADSYKTFINCFSLILTNFWKMVSS